MESQQLQRSNLGVLFVFMSLMKSLPNVARTEMLQRNIHLGREGDIVKMVQVEGAKCINT
jgi:hypothetical protein